MRPSMKNIIGRLCLAGIALGMLAASAQEAQAARRRGPWKGWSLGDKTYKKLNMFQRTQYDKASKLFNDGQYRAAARELEKFRTQFPASPGIPNVVFMQGYSPHWAKNRHTAIRHYHEVLDFWPERVSVAAPAKYWLAMAHIDNGDIRKGLEVLREMVDHDTYRKHWLAAGGLRRLADNYWKYEKYGQAVDYWKQAVRDFAKANRTEADRARDRVTAYYLNDKNFSDYDAWMVDPNKADDARHRLHVLGHAMHILRYIDRMPLKKDYKKAEGHRHEVRKAFVGYYQGHKEFYLDANRRWDYYVTLRELARSAGEEKLSAEALDEIIAMIKAIPDNGEQDKKWNWLFDKIRREDVAMAEAILGYMNDKLWAKWNRYELYMQQEEYKNCERILVDLEKTDHDKWAPRALNARASLYHHKMGKYPEAIKLYHIISKPPGTLWDIQDCYKRDGKLEDALRTLATIETMFPPEASKAAWTRTRYLAGAKRTDEAIASARRILKIYERSRESSYAHQFLEKHGIKTGGGVGEEKGF